MSDLIDQLANLQAMFGVEVALHPELKAALRHDHVGTHLHHRFVNLPVYTPAFAKLANSTLEQKKQAVKESDASKNWHRSIFLHERPYRLHALLEREPMMTDRQYWSAVASVWSDSEFPHNNKEAWRAIWTASRKGRSAAMSAREQGVLRRLQVKDTVTLWRGASHAKARQGLAWTTDLAIAQWFSRRFISRKQRPYVWRCEAPTCHLLAYLSGRNEREVIFDTREVHPSAFTLLATKP